MFTKSILQKILAVLARAMIQKYKPIIIGVTGSVGKTSAREAIAMVLAKKYGVRQPEKNYNNEIGLPLAIMGVEHCGRNVLQWLLVLAKTAGRASIIKTDYPEVVVLEYGIDRPGDMDRLLAIARPRIGVTSAVGDIPVHIEFFENVDALIAEKQKLIAALPAEGYAILNRDDAHGYAMRRVARAPVITYGCEASALIHIINYELHIISDKERGTIPDGITFKIEHQGSVVPFWLRGAVGIPHAYAAAAATAVGIAMGMNLVDISNALRDYTPQPGRMRLLPGIKGSLILDDTYNAAPASMRAALETLQALPGTRKIAVLGDMLELGVYAPEAHRAMGALAATAADCLIAVGPCAALIAAEARIRAPEMSERIFIFDDAKKAGEALASLIEEGDRVLVKGSQGMRMERVVEQILAQPHDAATLLARQDSYWKKRP